MVHRLIQLTNGSDDLGDYIRAAGKVKRFHTDTLIRVPTVADHTWHVLTLFDQLWPDDFSVAVARAIMYHDLAERSTGDLPAPVKWYAPRLKEALAAVESDIEAVYCPKPVMHLPEELRLKIKYCDMLELVLTVKDEYMLGNRTLHHIHQNGHEAALALLSKIDPNGEHDQAWEQLNELSVGNFDY